MKKLYLNLYMLPRCVTDKLLSVGIIHPAAVVNDEAAFQKYSTDTLRAEKLMVESKLLEQYNATVADIKHIESIIKKRDEIQSEQNKLAIAKYQDQLKTLQEIVQKQRELIIRLDSDRSLKVQKANVSTKNSPMSQEKTSQETTSQEETPQEFKKCETQKGLPPDPAQTPKIVKKKKKKVIQIQKPVAVKRWR